MPILEKDHYSLNELMERWRFSLQDVGYFAERGMLEVQTWLSDVLITKYKLKRTEDGDIVPVQVGVSILTGYYIVDPDELRKVFRATDVGFVRKFMSPDHCDVFSFQYKLEGTPIRLAALEVSKTERDRFEFEHDFTPRQTPSTKTGITPSSTGRPSVMKKITERFTQRVAMGEIEPSLSAEARYLREWILDECRGIHAPAVKTIVNNLRPHYAAYRETEDRP